MFTFLSPGTFFSPAMSISLSKWPMFPTIAQSFIARMCSTVMTSRLPVAVTNTSASLDDVLDPHDLVALHRRLQRVDGVDLGHDHARALAAERLRAALADVAVAAHDAELAGEHHVGRAVEAVHERVRQPYRLSNFDFVTESFTLMAGKRSVPAFCIS